jgi:hypothetical protein
VATRGRNVGQVAQVSTDGKYAFLEGTRYFKTWQDSAPHGFVDKVEIKTGQKSRVFEGQADMFETVTAALDNDFTKYVVSRESRTQVPDLVRPRWSVGTVHEAHDQQGFHAGIHGGGPQANSDHARGRVPLHGEPDAAVGLPSRHSAPGDVLVLPVRVHRSGRVRSYAAHEQRQSVPQAGPRTIEYLVTQGYAVANFDPPIVGSNGRINDNYVTDLVSNLSAELDELDKQGYIDRSRVGIGGHSYGAFSTVNAMVNTPFFKAGIAGDGAYNRTLTPLGFQKPRPECLVRGNHRRRRCVAFLQGRQDAGRGAHVSLNGRPERRHRPDQLDSHDAGASGAGKDGGALPLSV